MNKYTIEEFLENMLFWNWLNKGKWSEKDYKIANKHLKRFVEINLNKETKND